MEKFGEDEVFYIDKFKEDFKEFGKKSYFAKKHHLYQSNLSAYIHKKKFQPKIQKLIQEYYSMNPDEQKNFFSEFKKKEKKKTESEEIVEVKNPLLEFVDGKYQIKTEVTEKLGFHGIFSIAFNPEMITVTCSSNEKLEELKKKFNDEISKKQIEFLYSTGDKLQKVYHKLQSTNDSDSYTGTVGAIIKSENHWYAFTAAHNFLTENMEKKNGKFTVVLPDMKYTFPSVDWVYDKNYDIGWAEFSDEINFDTAFETIIEDNPFMYDDYNVVKIGQTTGRTFGKVKKVSYINQKDQQMEDQLLVESYSG
jgi:hypothetical protein